LYLSVCALEFGWVLHHSINLSTVSFVGQSREIFQGNGIRPKEMLLFVYRTLLKWRKHILIITGTHCLTCCFMCMGYCHRVTDKCLCFTETHLQYLLYYMR
jgi:hypothetical protein